MTNYERIKSMTVDEMADIFGQFECHYCICYMASATCSEEDCLEGHKAWLEQEYIEDED